MNLENRVEFIQEKKGISERWHRMQSSTEAKGNVVTSMNIQYCMHKG